VDARTKKGCSPFLLGCKEGHKEIVQLLAERGADLEASDQRNTTPLLAAFKVLTILRE
jgi:ankyrin repeat protein